MNLTVAATIALVAVGCSNEAGTHPAARSSSNVPVATPSDIPSRVALKSPTRLPNPSVAWHPCTGGFQCGSIRVPLDYEHPRGRHVALPLIRRQASDPEHRIGSLLLDPGGPGASGVEWLRSVWTLFSGLSQRFDLVAFDPRGVGQSSPLRCLSDSQLDRYFEINPAPTSQRERRRWVVANKRYDHSCIDGDRKFLEHLSTRDTARDMELIRRAVGDDKLTYMGFSYGTFLGEMYASMFPSHVRALALDAVIPPDLTLTQLIIGQTRGFVKDLDDFFSWCTTNGCSLTRYGDPSGAFTHLVNLLQNHPIPATADRDLTLGEAEYGVAEGLYDADSWPQLAEALTTAIEGSGSRLLAMFDNYALRDEHGHYANEFDAYNAIICTDHPAPSSAARYGELAGKLKKRFGAFGSFIAWQSLPCAFWPVRPEALPSGLGSHDLPPILYVGGTNDPATPYVWATQAHAETRGSILLTRVGDGHTSYGKSTCIHAAVDRYLIDLRLPPRHQRCTGS